MKEEAETKRIAEEEKRLKEDAETKRIAKEEKRLKEEAETKRKAEEEKRIKEKAESKRKVEEEKRIKEEAESKRKVEEEKRLKEEVETKRKAEEEKQRKKGAADKRKVSEERRFNEAAAKRKASEEQLVKKNKFNKLILAGVIVIVLILVGIFAFLSINSDPKIEPKGIKETIATEKPKIDLPIKKKRDTDKQVNAIKKPDSLKKSDSLIRADIIRKADSIEKANVIRKADSIKKVKEEYFLALRVSDTIDGGVIFTIDHSSKTGKIAYPEDYGPLTWTNAQGFVDQLGEGWRLPPRDTLQIMYNTIGQGKNNSGQFADKLYWSSTPFEEYQAHLIHFRDGNADYHYNKETRKHLFRVIRDFSRKE